ncbi:MAG: TrkA family potassium uptake protein, partial [Oscillospiraceae bacterium]
MKTFLVIGLGRFGTAVATELCALGNEVLAMDVREEP